VGEGTLITFGMSTLMVPGILSRCDSLTRSFVAAGFVIIAAAPFEERLMARSTESWANDVGGC